MEQSSGHVMESQVDWLTCSADYGAKADELRELGEKWATEELADGNRTKPFSFYGYTGVKAGRVRLGLGARGTLLQLSGDAADRHLAAALACSSRVTRLDLAVTFQFDRERHDTATGAYLDYLQYARSHSGAPDAHFHSSLRGGETLYIGDRTSNWFARIYDKQAESREPRYVRAWRYELESKGDSAKALAVSTADAVLRADHCQSAVYCHLDAYGVRLPFLPSGGQVLRPGFTRRTDSDRSLGWLADRVSPAVGRLIDEGRAEEVLAALRLSALPEVDQQRLRPLANAPGVHRALRALD